MFSVVRNFTIFIPKTVCLVFYKVAVSQYKFGLCQTWKLYRGDVCIFFFFKHSLTTILNQVNVQKQGLFNKMFALISVSCLISSSCPSFVQNAVAVMFFDIWLWRRELVYCASFVWIAVVTGILLPWVHACLRGFSTEGMFVTAPL